MSLEREIDRLYQVPLAAFITERNALAKRSGAEAARVKAIEKPNAAAWAVNQIYWHDRPLFDRLIKAATRARAAHTRALAGQKGDVHTADLQHHAAIRDAIARAREVLVSAGDAATEATLTAVSETLRALPAEGAPGRLARPIRLIGFAAFGDMLRHVDKAASEPGEIVPFKTAGIAADVRIARADRVAAEEAARDREAVRARRKKLESTTRQVNASLARAQRQLAALKQERHELNERLQAVNAQIDNVRRDVTRLEGEAAAAARELQALIRQE